jgi:NAD/NADP transhydrogenase beta subunit
LGQYVGRRVEPTSLPQTVAAFHSLVGVAASATAIGEYMNTPDTTQLDSGKLSFRVEFLTPCNNSNQMLILVKFGFLF